MLPYILAAFGGYLIGDSLKGGMNNYGEQDYAKGGKISRKGHYTGKIITTDSGDVMIGNISGYRGNGEPVYDVHNFSELRKTMLEKKGELANSKIKELIKKMADANKMAYGDGGLMSDGGWITAKEVSEDWDFYSDMYKEKNGFRPRSLSDEELADWLNSNYKIVTKDYDGEKRKMIVAKDNKEKSLLHFVLNEASSGSIANKTKYSSYKDIDAVRNKAVQILMRDGDREYSLDSFTDLIQEAVLEYDSEKIN